MSETMKQIFILSGQSNMAGRGGVIPASHHHKKHWDGVVPPECHPHPTILRLNAHLHWEQARDPLHADIDHSKTCGVGPGMAFANAVQDRVGGTMGLVPCAVGGTAIKEWARGGHLYESMIKRAKFAVEGGVGEVKAVLWYQGESDCHECDVGVYKEKMEMLISHVREDISLPLLPFIQVALASGDKKYIEKIREAQLSIKLPNVICVDAKGLKLNHDNLHLSTEAQVQLGKILADAYLCNFCSSLEPQ
ncbi:hypothetical protein KSS87_010152 [Heliosperma pusillum]|nr:hypothetical protein KSS87_010152 [Heliosperma pusillum]